MIVQDQRPRAPHGTGASRSTRLAAGLEDLRRGRFDQAAGAFEALAIAGPGEPRAARLAAEARVALALARVHAGDCAGARPELERALRFDPWHPGAARQLARVMLRAGEARPALAWIERAKVRDPGAHDLGLLRAVGLEALGRREAAREALDRTLAATLRAPLPRVRRRGTRRAGPSGADPAPPQAHVALERRAAEQPFHADLRCRLAARLFEWRPAEAAQHLEAALALNPRYLRARVALGLLRLEQRRAGEAVAELEAARELEPAYPDVRAWLGLARLAAGDARGAVSSLERAVALQREFARGHRHLALAHHALGHTGDALRAARRGVIRDAGAPLFAERLAVPGLEVDGADEDDLERALAIRPASADLHLALGRRRVELGDPGEARRAFRAALAHQPGYADAALGLAQAEIALGRAREAEALLTELVAWRPGWVDAQALLGRTRLTIGDASGAVTPLRAALRQRPGLEPARTDLAWALLGAGGSGADRGAATAQVSGTRTRAWRPRVPASAPGFVYP